MAELEAGIRRAETALFAQFGLTPSERFVVVDAGGARARLRVLEVGSGSPVLFLHAASWFAAHWAPLLAHLPGWRAICVDMPGHGLSDGVDYRDQDLRKLQVEIFSQLFDQLAISGAPVVGNSLGGIRVLPNARTETHPGGHHPQLTGPQASARALQAFLS